MIRRSMTESLAARAAARGDIAGINSTALTEKAHFHRLANLYPNIHDLWDFRHSRNRPTALAVGTEFPNLVLGRSPAVVDRVAGLALTANALRFTGSAAATTPRIRLPDAARPEPGMRQYGWLLMGNIIAKTSTIAHGMMSWGAATTGMAITLPFTAAATGNFATRFNNANIGAVYDETYVSPVYPPGSSYATYTVGTPFMLGHGWYNGGTASLATRRSTSLGGRFGVQSITGNDAFSDEGVDAPFYIGGTAANNNTGFVFDLMGVAIVKWMKTQGDVPAPVHEVWREAYRMLGLDLLAGYVPPPS